MLHYLRRVQVCRSTGITRRLPRIAVGVLCAGIAAAALPARLTGQTALLTDYGTHMEPALPSLPAAGGTFVDPTFHTTIMRLTDSNDGSDCRVEYSYWPTFNVNSTRASALCVNSGVDRTKIWTFDPTNFRRGSAILMPMLLQSSDAIWSASDPNIIYGHSITNLLVAFNASTQTTTTIKDFSGIVPSGGQLNQMSMSANDDEFAFHLTNSSGTPVGYIVWKRSTNTLLLNRAETGIDEVQIDKSGRYLEAGFTSGNNKIWDLQANPPTSTSLTWGTDGFFHHDSGHGTLFTYNGQGNGVAYRQSSAPHNLTALMALSSSNKTGHMSMRADNEGWGLISNYNNDGSGVTSPFDNEVFQVATDGSGEVRRIAHHRSVYNDYYDAPFANISPDGQFVAFSSNWGHASGRRDVFVAKIPPAPGSGTGTSAPPPPPPETLTCPAPATGAFTGCYYADDQFSTVAMTRTDSYPLAFDWGNGSPDPAVPVDHFSTRWQGNFNFNAASYTFTVTVDDGARLYVDGQLVLDKWLNEPATTYTVTRNMTAGTHAIRLDYYDAYAGATAKLSWASGSTAAPSTDTIAPSVPKGLAAYNIAATSFGVKWSASTDNVGVVGYRIEVNGAVLANVSAPSGTISNVSCNKAYYVTVSAVDAAGNRSAYSSPLGVRTASCSTK